MQARSMFKLLVQKSRHHNKKVSNDVAFKIKYYTSSFRMLPSFIVIGAMKCGTSSLYQYLAQHPCVLPARRKEVHYFDDSNYESGIAWYKANFPMSIVARTIGFRNRQQVITGEASPYYLSFPLTPERMSTIMPSVKLIAMLRNPIDRAYSHYHHQVRHGREPLSFDEAIDAEETRIKGEREKIVQSGCYYSYNYWAYSYLERGLYIDQIEHWMKFFSKEQLLILKSEDFFSSPAEELKKTLRFLDLPDFELKVYPKVNTGKYKKMPSTTRQRLQAFFKNYNNRLNIWAGKDFGWN
jgi:hypothetical protein